MQLFIYIIITNRRYLFVRQRTALQIFQKFQQDVCQSCGFGAIGFWSILMAAWTCINLREVLVTVICSRFSHLSEILDKK